MVFCSFCCFYIEIYNSSLAGAETGVFRGGGALLGSRLCNHNRIVFKERAFWTALTWHIRMKIAFFTKDMIRKYFRFFFMMIKILRVIKEKTFLKKYSTSQQGTNKISATPLLISFSFNVMKFKIIVLKILTYY